MSRNPTSQIRFGIDQAAPLSSYSVVEGNRFVDRGSIYVMGGTLIAHPDVIDMLRGYGPWKRHWRRLVRWAKWRLWERRSLVNRIEATR